MQKKILITGANGNLGVAVVKRFLKDNWHVIAVDNSNNHLEFAASKKSFQWHAVNLADEKDAADFVTTILQQHQEIDAAALLVGGFAMGNLEKTDIAQIRQMTSLNFDTAFHCSKLLFGNMLKKGNGRIVFIGARPAIMPTQGKNMVAYALSKSMLFTLASMMNAEAKGKNVTASVVVPSTIDTPANRSSMPDTDPSNWVTPDQVAATIAFICSEAGSPLREMVIKVYNNS